MGRRQRKAEKNLRAMRAAEAKIDAEDAQKAERARTEDARRAERARKRQETKAEWDAKSPEEKKQVYKWVGIGAAALVVVIALAAAFGGDDDKDADSTSTPTSTPVKPPKSSAPSTRPAPTDAQVTKAFESFIDERAKSGVALAKSATSVTVSGGVVTVVVDPESAGLSTWAVLETSPFDNQAEFFGVPVVFNDDDGVWLRESVQRVDVVDADGQSLGSLTAGELNKIGTG